MTVYWCESAGTGVVVFGVDCAGGELGVGGGVAVVLEPAVAGAAVVSEL